MAGLTHPAARDDLGVLWSVASTAHLFHGCGEFAAWWEEAPWRVRATDAGESVVLGAWRTHLDLLAVRGLWCPEHRIPLLLEDLRAVAREHGFGRLLGPLVTEEAVGPYLASNMEPITRIVVYRARASGAPPGSPPDGVALREGNLSDLAAVAGVDAESFDEFWRYDAEGLARYVATERLVVAERAGRPIGYTLSTARGGEATIGRLAVSVSERGRGVGGSLIAEAVSHAARGGAAAVTLCTQEENAVSRRLYRRAGFRELPGRLVGTVSEPV